MLTQGSAPGVRPGARYLLLLAFCILSLWLAGCDSDLPPTQEVSEPTVEESDEIEVAQATPDLSPTSTLEPTVEDTAAPAPTEPPPPTSTPLPTATPVTPTATDTVEPTPTDTAVPPTNTAVPPTNTAPPPTNTAPAPAQPTSPPPPPTEPPPPAEPVLGTNILPNGSFEEGWYNLGGAPELQLPNGWSFDWEEGPTGYGSQPWDVWVRPETRVLPSSQLPEHERSLFIREGDHTIKMFKGNGAISFQLFRDLTLEPGTYVFEINLFPDLFSDYVNGQKIWASDPLSGEVRFILGGGGSDWILPAFGQWNTLNYSFTLAEPQTIRLGAAFRGRYALENNGWFLDQWSLKKVQN
ncbi:MAG TPA: hypothetical protein VF177_12195 [Anaerolineae bacterium]